MPYVEVPIDKIEDNPFQTRKEYDKDAALSIGTSVLKARHGLLQAPLARPHPEKTGFYQLGFGHGRIAGLKEVGVETVTLRVEDMTDSEMKKYVLIENVNRSDLTDDEMWDGLEQFRKDKGWSGKEHNFQSMMTTETGVDPTTILRHYRTKPILDALKLFHGRVSTRYASIVLPISNQYDNEIAVKVLEWATKKDWGAVTFDKVQQNLRKFDESVFYDILEFKPGTEVIAKLTETIDLFTPEEQKQILEQIRVRRYNQEDAIKFIDRVIKGDISQTTEVKNEAEQIMKDFNDVATDIVGWGFNHFMILGEQRWQEACEIFTTIEDKMRWLKTRGWEK